MKLKRKLMNESSVDADVLKAIEKLPKKYWQYLFDGIQCMFMEYYKSVREFMISEGSEIGAEDLFWLGVRSPMAPMWDNDHVIYDRNADEIIAVDNPKFTSRDLANRLKKAGFEYSDPMEIADLLEDYGDMEAFREEYGI